MSTRCTACYDEAANEGKSHAESLRRSRADMIFMTGGNSVCDQHFASARTEFYRQQEQRLLQQRGQMLEQLRGRLAQLAEEDTEEARDEIVKINAYLKREGISLDEYTLPAPAGRTVAPVPLVEGVRARSHAAARLHRAAPGD